MRNTYKVFATYTVDVEVEIMAESEEDALRQLYRKDFTDVIDEGKILCVNSENEQAKLTEYEEVTVEVTGIYYDISATDFYDFIERQHPELDYYSDEFDKMAKDMADEEKARLPKTMAVTLKYVPVDDLESEISDAISNKTGWLVSGFDSYKIVEKPVDKSDENML